jgi:hypothetical membrane protein
MLSAEQELEEKRIQRLVEIAKRKARRRSWYYVAAGVVAVAGLGIFGGGRSLRSVLALEFITLAIWIPAINWGRWSQTQRYLAAAAIGAALMLMLLYHPAWWDAP